MKKFKLTQNERKWLNKLYEWLKSGKRPHFRKVRSFLYNEFPEDFDPATIDKSLTGHYKGEDITLLGIHVIDPESGLMDKANKVISCVRTMLIEDEKKEKATAQEIAEIAKLSKEDVAFTLSLASRYMRLYDSASLSNDPVGIDSMQLKDAETFDSYLHFTSIEEKIEDSIEKDKKLKEKKSRLPQTVEHTDSRIVYDPIFSSRAERVDLGMCFVLMPFTQKWSKRVYRDLIRENIEPLGIQCLRADNLSGQIIMEDIWLKINQAAFIIADVTGKNPNVMYEMGIVHSIGKPNILMTQEIDEIPFDFAHLRHHHYEDNIEGFRDFGRTLKNLVIELYAKYYPEIKLNDSLLGKEISPQSI